MKYKFSDITASYTTEKRRNTSLWARIFSRPLSFITAYIFGWYYFIFTLGCA